jgi:hypothetical protein
MLFKGMKDRLLERRRGHKAVAQDYSVETTPSERMVASGRFQEVQKVLEISNESRLYIYQIKMDGSGYAYHIVGDQPLMLRAAVTSAMKAIPDQDLVDQTDVLLAIVNKVCEQTGFQLIEVDGRLNIERMYWRESERRTQGGTDDHNKDQSGS